MPKYKNRQKGGRVQMPIQYFNPTGPNLNYFPEGSHQLQYGNTSYGPYIPTSYGMPTGDSFPNMTGPNLAAYPNGTNLQTGGSIYDTIINPKTGSPESIYGRRGLRILKKYIKYSQSGGVS